MKASVMIAYLLFSPQVAALFEGAATCDTSHYCVLFGRKVRQEIDEWWA